MSKKFFFLSISMMLILLTGCNREMKSTTSSYLQVIEKDSSEGKYYITAKNPYDKNAIEVKIDLKVENVWNLVKEGEIYITSYYSYEPKSTEGVISSIALPNEKDESK